MEDKRFIDPGSGVPLVHETAAPTEQNPLAGIESVGTESPVEESPVVGLEDDTTQSQ